MTTRPKVVCVTQARTTSTRLPRKVMLDIGGVPLLTHHLARLKRCLLVDELVLATTINASDDEVSSLGESLGVRVVRGSEHDVLSRYVLASQSSNADIVVRVTSDCPLIDPGLVDRVVQTMLSNKGTDYAYLDMTELPRGLDAEVLRSSLLEKANEDPMTNDFEREHVTPYIYNRPEQYRLMAVAGVGKTPAWRWCVDQLEDFELVSRMLEELLPVRPHFTWMDCAELMTKHPEWAQLNQHVKQKGK